MMFAPIFFFGSFHIQKVSFSILKGWDTPTPVQADLVSPTLPLAGNCFSDI
jgi:hypothetical protein